MEAVTNVYQGVFGATHVEYKKFLGFVEAFTAFCGGEDPLKKDVELQPNKYTVNRKYGQKGANAKVALEVIPPEPLKRLTDILEANNFKEEKNKAKKQTYGVVYNLNDINQLKLYVNSAEVLDSILEKKSEGSWLLPKGDTLTALLRARYDFNSQNEIIAEITVVISSKNNNSDFAAYLEHHGFKELASENKQPVGAKKEGADANIPPPAEAVGKVPEVKNPAAPAANGDNAGDLQTIIAKLNVQK